MSPEPFLPSPALWTYSFMQYIAPESFYEQSEALILLCPPVEHIYYV